MRNSSNFVAGKIGDYNDEWHFIFESNETDCEVWEWVYGAAICSLLKEIFGVSTMMYGSPRKCFINSNKCRHFVVFINGTIADQLKSGDKGCVGKSDRLTVLT